MADPVKRGPPSLADVQQHAQKLTEQLLDKAEKAGAPTTTTLDQVAAASLPDFSKATAAVGEDGKPILSGQTIQPTREEMHPEGGQIPNAAAQTMERAVAEAQGKPLPERDPKTGKFKSDAPAVEAPATEQPQAAADEAKAAELLAAKGKTADAPAVEVSAPAAEAAPQADAAWPEEVTLTDEDTGDAFIFRAKDKESARRIRDGYTRLSKLNRHGTFLAEARPVLEPLIANGQMRNLLPIIEAGVKDEAFGNFIIAAYNRRVTGMPLEAPAVAIAAPAPAQPAATEAVDLGLSLDQDPWLAQQLTPLERQIQETRSRLDAMEAARTTEDNRVAAQRAQQEQSSRTVQQMHQELARAYPGEWSGDVAKDDAQIRRTIKFAHDSGLVQRYGASVPTLVWAYEQLRAERNAAAASPAAQTIADAERTAATRVAASAANATPGGAPRTTSAPAKKPLPALPPTRTNGQATDPKLIAAAALARIAATQEQGGAA